MDAFEGDAVLPVRIPYRRTVAQSIQADYSSRNGRSSGAVFSSKKRLLNRPLTLICVKIGSTHDSKIYTRLIDEVASERHVEVEDTNHYSSQLR